MRNMSVVLSYNEDGSANLLVQRHFLHSRYNARQEAERFAEELCRQYKIFSHSHSMQRQGAGESKILLVGTGWGYVIEALARKKACASFVFYEALGDVYALLQKEGRLEELHALGAKIYGDFPSLHCALTKAKTQLHIIVSPPYQRLLPDLRDKLRSMLQKDSAAVDLHSRQRFLRQWTRNAFALLLEPKDLHFILQSKERAACHTQPPCVVYCGAAPSLWDEIDHIPAEAFVIAADTALAPLFAKGMRVDMAICVDSGRGTWYHLQAASKACKQGSSFPLPCPVLSWTGSLGGLCQYFEKVYYYRSTLPFDQMLGLGPLQGVPEWRNPSRNSAGLALHIAKLLGADKMYFTGASLFGKQEYHNKLPSHVRGTGYVEYILPFLGRTFSLEMYQTGNYTHSAGKYTVAKEGAVHIAKEHSLKIEELSLGAKAFLSAGAKKPLSFDEAVESRAVSKEVILRFLERHLAAMDWKALLSLGLDLQELEGYLDCILARQDLAGCITSRRANLGKA